MLDRGALLTDTAEKFSQILEYIKLPIERIIRIVEVCLLEDNFEQIFRLYQESISVSFKSLDMNDSCSYTTFLTYKILRKYLRKFDSIIAALETFAVSLESLSDQLDRVVAPPAVLVVPRRNPQECLLRRRFRNHPYNHFVDHWLVRLLFTAPLQFELQRPRKKD